MKVIFMEDVPKVAKAGDMKEVADGYGRNFLIPKKLAVLADPSAMNSVESQLKKRARVIEDMGVLGQQLENMEFTLKARVGEQERLYGSITNADIAAEIESAAGVVIDKRKIEIEEPIRQLGTHEVTIRLAKDIMPKIRLTVIPEEAS